MRLMVADRASPRLSRPNGYESIESIGASLIDLIDAQDARLEPGGASSNWAT